jgi:hypothetical protein
MGTTCPIPTDCLFALRSSIPPSPFPAHYPTSPNPFPHPISQHKLTTHHHHTDSPIKHVLITQDVAELKCAALYFQRGQAHQFHAAIAAEEEKREEELRSKENAGVVGSFEEYRKGLVAGVGAGG